MPNMVGAPFEALFLTPGAGARAYADAMDAAHQALLRTQAGATRPYSGAKPEAIARRLAEKPVCPEAGAPLADVLSWLETAVMADSVAVSHPRCAAHLHCPPLVPALAAEALLSGANQSMDSFDQAPAATLLEQRVTAWLCERFGYGVAGDGTFTSGGTQSNFMGMLLARDRYARRAFGWDVQTKGLPPESSRFRILASDAAHFTIKQSAALLGLGHDAVVPIPTGADRKLDADAVDAAIARLTAEGLLPIAIAATAGTTDFGSIDPLAALADVAARRGVWLHVDAAYGGGLVMSDRHGSRLAGIERADSITVDFHKLFYQPISCGAFLLKDAADFDLMRLHAEYLNPADNEGDGIPDLVTKSIATTRRFDALKLFVSLQAIGRQGFEAMVDATIALAADAARAISADPALALVAEPELNAVVFRLATSLAPEAADMLHRDVRLALLYSGEAVVAQTRVDGRVCLKFTLLNPRATIDDVQAMLGACKRTAGAIGTA